MRTLMLSLTLLLAAGCSGTSQVSVSTRLGSPRVAGATALQQGLTAQALPALSLDRVRIVVRRVKLERENSQTELEVASGPYLLDVSGAALSGGITKQFDVQVPAGTYDELAFDIHKLGGEDTVTDAGLKEMQALGASIVVDGTVDGAAFTFVSDLDEQQQFEHTFQVGDGSDNLTLNIDPAGWFLAADGSFLDPRQASAQDAIEANIKRSIDAFDDDDHDGAEDEHDGVDGSDDHGDGGTDDHGGTGSGSGEVVDGGHG